MRYAKYSGQKPRVKCKWCSLPMLGVGEPDPRRGWNKIDMDFCDCPEEMPMTNDLTIPDLFTAEDFEKAAAAYCRYLTFEKAAEYANARFRDWARGLTKVYGTNLNDKKTSAGPDPQWFYGLKNEEYDTHIALLAFVQEIKKECEHEPEVHEFMGIHVLSSACKHCKISIKAARWEPAE